MKHLKTWNWLFIISVLLIIPALFINLGKMSVINDEAIRALVALEMKISGNLITPTIGGILYFHKPPLYNWIILVFYNLFNNYSELVTRGLTVFFLLIFCITIYLFTKKELGKKLAIINALIFLTCGRILFYDSMRGLIDIGYSWLIYTNMMLIYYFYQKNKLHYLFLSIYAISGITFLMKGFPTVVFTGITLFTFFIYMKKFNLLFNKYHFIGIGLFILMVGSYYLSYYKIEPEAIDNAFMALLDQSTRRTAFKYGFLDSVIHVFTYPFEWMYHYFPWSLMLPILIIKSIRKRALANPFIKFNLLIFLFNMIVYWISPEVYARYVLMMLPLIFTVFLFSYKKMKENEPGIFKAVNIVFLIIAVLLALICLALPFHPETKNYNYVIISSILAGALIIFLTIKYYKTDSLKLFVLIIALLIVRIHFNFFVIQSRYDRDYATICKKDALKIAEKYKEYDLLLYGEINDGYAEFNKVINYESMYYIIKERMQILHKTDQLNPGKLYIMEKKDFNNKKFVKLDKMRIKDYRNELYIIELIDEE